MKKDIVKMKEVFEVKCLKCGSVDTFIDLVDNMFLRFHCRECHQDWWSVGKEVER